MMYNNEFINKLEVITIKAGGVLYHDEMGKTVLTLEEANKIINDGYTKTIEMCEYFDVYFNEEDYKFLSKLKENEFLAKIIMSNEDKIVYENDYNYEEEYNEEYYSNTKYFIIIDTERYYSINCE